MTVLVIPAADVVSDAYGLLAGLLWSVDHQGLRDFASSVVVCFDGCKPEFVAHVQQQFPWIESEVNTGNRLNFAGNSNRGLRLALARGQDAVVVNQDCVLPRPGVFMRLCDFPGIAVPSSVVVCGEPPLKLDDLVKLDQAQPTEVTRVGHNKLVGFCMFLSIEVLEKVGLFDERFKATWEDDDICVRACLAGFPVQHVNIAVHHYGSRCGSYNLEKLQINKWLYQRKWSVPPEIEHKDMNSWILARHVWSPEMRED